MKTQLTKNLERDLLKNLKKQKHPEFMRQPWTETQEEDREFEEPQEYVDPPQEKNPHKRKPTCVQEAIQGAEIYGAQEENHRERKRTRSCSGYVALFFDFIDKEPSNYEEAVERKEWKEDMIEEY